MRDTVVDSSVVAKWILPEPDSAQAKRLITEVALKGHRLIVLDLAFVEVANAIWKLHHRGLASLDDTRQSLDDLLQIPVHVEPARRLLKPGLEIAAKYDRAVYDALFVALCQDLGLPGVTADEPLYNTTHADFPQLILLRNWLGPAFNHSRPAESLPLAEESLRLATQHGLTALAHQIEPILNRIRDLLK
jgi:predicted nucleic acid-binding protein